VLNFSELGRAQNFRPPVTLAASGLHRLPVIRETVLALLIGIGLLAVLAGVNVLLHRRDRRYWALAFCPLGGLTLVAVNPYGQEGIFRAALFGLPWLAALGAPVIASLHLPARLAMTERLPARLAPARELPGGLALAGRLPARLALAGISVCLTVAFLVSSFGLDAVNVIRPGDLAAVRYFQQHGGPRPPTRHYLLLLGAGDLPTTPGLNGGWHQTWGRDRIYMPLPDKPPLRTPDAQVKLITSRLLHETADPSAPPTLFALWSPVQAEYSTAYALQTPEQSAALRDAFKRSAYWSVAFDQDGTYVFRFEPSGYPGGGGGGR
jgi:hypothetical protein